MKSTHLLLGSALLGAGFLFSFSANSQSSAWDKNQYTGKMPIVSKWQNGNGKHMHLSSGYQEKSNTENRLIAYVELKNDGVLFNPKDSTKLGWMGNNNHPDAAGAIIDRHFHYAYPKNRVHLLKLTNFTEGYTPIDLRMISDSVNIRHDWNAGSSAYNKSYKTKNNWGTNGNLASQIRENYNGTSWDIDSSTVYTYDAQNRVTEFISQVWNGSALENHIRELYSYDVEGRLYQTIEMEWSIGATTWENKKKFNNTFDAQNRIDRVVEQSWNTSSWVNEQRETRDYTWGVEVLIEEWDSNQSQWKNDMKVSLSYDSNSNPTLFTGLIWDGSNWNGLVKHTLSFDGSGNLTDFLEQHANGHHWDDVQRLTYSYSSDHAVTEAIRENFNESTNSFENTNRAVYTYNSNGLSSTFTEESWDGSAWTEEVDENTKYIFYYEEIDVTGIQETLSGTDFTLFPNPTTDKLHVQMVDSKSVTELAVIDLSGRIVYQTQGKLSTSEVTIPVNNLMNGMYFLHITSDGQKGTKPFVVKH